MPQSPNPFTLDEADALLLAGLAASQDNDAERALRLFAEASAASPASALPHFLIGSEYAALGQTDKAESALASAILLAPELHLARYQLGLLQFSSGRPAVAVVTWGPLFALDEAQALAHFVRGFAALAHGDLAAAQNHFEAGLALNHENPALSADVRKVLNGIGQVGGPSVQADVPAPAAPGDQPAAHILVSNYGKFGTLH